jgi:hypothetical protein
MLDVANPENIGVIRAVQKVFGKRTEFEAFDLFLFITSPHFRLHRTKLPIFSNPF